MIWSEEAVESRERCSLCRIAAKRRSDAELFLAGCTGRDSLCRIAAIRRSDAELFLAGCTGCISLCTVRCMQNKNHTENVYAYSVCRWNTVWGAAEVKMKDSLMTWVWLLLRLVRLYKLLGRHEGHLIKFLHWSARKSRLIMSHSNGLLFEWCIKQE